MRIIVEFMNACAFVSVHSYIYIHATACVLGIMQQRTHLHTSYAHWLGSKRLDFYASLLWSASKGSGSFSGTINVSRAAADRHTWFRFNVQNAVKRTCKHSDIFYFFLRLCCFIVHHFVLIVDAGCLSFFGAAEAPAAKTLREIVFKSLDRAGESGTAQKQWIKHTLPPHSNCCGRPLECFHTCCQQEHLTAPSAVTVLGAFLSISQALHLLVLALRVSPLSLVFILSICISFISYTWTTSAPASLTSSSLKRGPWAQSEPPHYNCIGRALQRLTEFDNTLDLVYF